MKSVNPRKNIKKMIRRNTRQILTVLFAVLLTLVLFIYDLEAITVSISPDPGKADPRATMKAQVKISPGNSVTTKGHPNEPSRGGTGHGKIIVTIDGKQRAKYHIHPDGSVTRGKGGKIEEIGVGQKDTFVANDGSKVEVKNEGNGKAKVTITDANGNKVTADVTKDGTTKIEVESKSGGKISLDPNKKQSASINKKGDIVHTECKSPCTIKKPDGSKEKSQKQGRGKSSTAKSKISVRKLLMDLEEELDHTLEE